MKKRSVVSIILISTVLPLAIIVGFLYARTTPYYSLYMFKKALIERDAPQVLKYLDTDSILDNMARDILARMDKKEPARNKFEEHMQGAGQEAVRQLLPQLKKQMGQSLTDLLLSYDNEKLFSDLQKVTVFAVSVETKDDRALIRQRGKDKISFTMKRAPEGHWRIDSIDTEELKLFK